MVKRLEKMEQSTEDSIKMEKSMEKANLNDRMAAIILESFSIMKLRDKGNIFGLMGECMMVIGRIIKCMGKESSNGMMERNMKVII